MVQDTILASQRSSSDSVVVTSGMVLKKIEHLPNPSFAILTFGVRTEPWVVSTMQRLLLVCASVSGQILKVNRASYVLVVSLCCSQTKP